MPRKKKQKKQRKKATSTSLLSRISKLHGKFVGQHVRERLRGKPQTLKLVRELIIEGHQAEERQAAADMKILNHRRIG